MRSERFTAAVFQRRYPRNVRRTLANANSEALTEIIQHLINKPRESPLPSDVREWLVVFSYRHFRLRRSFAPKEARKLEGQWLALAIRYLHPMLVPTIDRPLSRESLAEVLSTDFALIQTLLEGSQDEVLKVLGGDFDSLTLLDADDVPDYSYLQYDAKTYEKWSKDGAETFIHALDLEFHPPQQLELGDVLRLLVGDQGSDQPPIIQPHHKRLERLLQASANDPVHYALVQLVYTDFESVLQHIDRTVHMNRRYMMVSVVTVLAALIAMQIDWSSKIMLGLIFGMILFILYIGMTFDAIAKEWRQANNRLDFLETLVFGEEDDQ